MYVYPNVDIQFRYVANLLRTIVEIAVPQINQNQ